MSSAQLLRIAAQRLSECPPIRVSTAALLLELSEPTIRTWTREGVLEAAREAPRLLLDPRRLHEALHAVRDLREQGQTAELLEDVWHRLSNKTWQEWMDLST